jgi:hypothetical protein
VLGLLLLIALAFFLIQCLRKRKEAHHRKTSRFWRGLFAPSQPAERASPMMEVQGIGGPEPLHPQSFTDSNTTMDPGTFAARKTFDSFKAAVASKSNVSASKRIPNFFFSSAKGDDPFSPDMAERGLARKGSNDEFVEVCLDENVALEEQTKAENRRREEVASWDAARAKMSPFPSTYFALRPPQLAPLI